MTSQNLEGSNNGVFHHGSKDATENETKYYAKTQAQDGDLESKNHHPSARLPSAAAPGVSEAQHRELVVAGDAGGDSPAAEGRVHGNDGGVSRRQEGSLDAGEGDGRGKENEERQKDGDDNDEKTFQRDDAKGRLRLGGSVWVHHAHVELAVGVRGRELRGAMVETEAVEE